MLLASQLRKEARVLAVRPGRVRAQHIGKFDLYILSKRLLLGFRCRWIRHLSLVGCLVWRKQWFEAIRVRLDRQRLFLRVRELTFRVKKLLSHLSNQDILRLL